MTERVYYTRHVSEGGRVTYRPTAEAWPADAFPVGDWLVSVRPGLRRRRKVELSPDYAAILAAALEGLDAATEAVKAAMLAAPVDGAPAHLRERVAAFAKASPDIVELWGGGPRDLARVAVDAIARVAAEAKGVA